MTPTLQRLAFFAVGCVLAFLLFGCGPEVNPVGHLPADPRMPTLACDAGCSTDSRTISHEGVVFTLAPEDRQPPPFPGHQ